MMRHTFQRLALILFCIYLAVLPGSTIVVALDRVPGWGAWMGGALLLLQGAAALFWLLGRHGARGGLAALLVFLLAWAVEHAGVTSGMPFGHYHYTGALQPQLFGTIPLAIPCAWLMVAAGAWQIATTDPSTPLRAGDRPFDTAQGRRPTTDPSTQLRTGDRPFDAAQGRRPTLRHSSGQATDDRPFDTAQDRRPTTDPSTQLRTGDRRPAPKCGLI